MRHLISKLIVFITALFLVPVFIVTPVFANNPPDSGYSNISANGQAPADGQNTITVTVTLQDSSGTALNGDNVTFTDSTNGSASLNPTSATLDSSGKATFTITSTTAGTDNISVTDTSSNTTLSNLGHVVFTPTSTPTPAGCSDPAPGSVPKITSAVATGTGKITLTWTAAISPVTSYLLAFGIAPGQYIYGNPNIGNQSTTSYVVSSLATNKTYYFAIKAVNGCTPGGFSNEVSASTLGNATPVTPKPTADVTVIANNTPTSTPTVSVTNAPLTTSSPIQHLIPTKPSSGLTDTKVLEYIGVSVLALTILGIFFYLKDRHDTGRRRRTL